MQNSVIEKLRRKIKFGANIPLKVFKKPKHKSSVTSDLFPIRNDEDWSTEFEFLNLPGLIEGDVSSKHSAKMVFFNSEGMQLGIKEIEIHNLGRKSISLNQILKDGLQNATTFAVFHRNTSSGLDLDGSYMAERGYTGYRFKNLQVKGYVHGNLDAVSFDSGAIKTLGNYGFFPKIYRVQHLMTGPAVYDFAFTNPTKKNKVKIKLRLLTGNGSRKLKPIYLKSKGSTIISIQVDSSQTLQLSIQSLLYLCRPVVFRKSQNAMDVFHG